MKQKKIKLIFICMFCFNSIFSLDLINFHNYIGNLFESLIDNNAGSTVFPVLSIPFGGKAEALGTAYSAYGKDIGFFDYNPAASATLEKTELAFFHNSWIADTGIESIAYTTRYGNFGLGFALKMFYASFSQWNMFGERVSNGYYTETVGYFNASYTFFPGYDFKGLTIGVNLKGAYRGVPDFADNLYNEIIFQSGLSQSSFGLMGDLGMKMRFNFLKTYSSRDENVNLSLVFQNLGFVLTDFSDSGNLETNEALPSKIVFGFSYKPIRPMVFTCEIRQPINLFDFSTSEMWELGVGLGVSFTDFFSLQTGFLLLGGYPRFSLGVSLFAKGLWFDINYTLDITSSLNPLNRISLGLKFDLGDEGRKEIQDEIDKMYNEGLYLYSIGKMEDAILVWKSLLNIDPYFDPAKKGVAAAENSLKLLNQIMEIQNLD